MDHDCIVVGAGPTGTVLATLLGQAGHRVLVLERDPEVYPLPRAVHMDHEIVRVLQQIGIADALKAVSSPVGRYVFQNAAGDVLLDIDGGARMANSGHPASLMFVQPELEAMLRARLVSTPGVDVRFGATALRIDADPQGAGVTFEQNGQTQHSRVRYLIGCDGASSLVRRAIGTAMTDLNFDEPWVVVDTRITGHLDLPPDAAFQFCEPARPTTCVPAGPGRRRWEFMLLPGETPEAMGRPEAIWPLLARWGGPENLALVRIAVYRFHALVAERWRQGPLLLAGDAAHQTPPFMGQGLCSGIRDAANLAWKLDGVLAGRAAERLLDSYQAERAPHIRQVVETSVAMGRIVCELNPARAAQRDAAMIAARAAGSPAIRASDQGQVAPLTDGLIRTGDPGAGRLFPQPGGHRLDAAGRLDDVVGCGTRLVVTDRRLLPDPQTLRDRDIEPVILGDAGADGFIESEPPGAASWLAQIERPAALVRPDHYVFGTAGTAAEVEGLVDEFTAAVDLQP
ncbi:MAG: bifunctional 3-(3-hydroxy-phenyl)propionate/3-hydroxycinnamic acid hydroxylase [Pseudomonadales bacterium]